MTAALSLSPVPAAPSSSSAPVLTADDYFHRSAEFRLWLHSTLDLHLDALPTSRSHDLFTRFVADWNAGRLPPHYYKGVDSSTLPPSTLTKHRWAFAEKMTDDERLAMASTRDSVDTSTYHHTYAQEFAKVPEAAPQRGGGEARGRKGRDGREAERGREGEGRREGRGDKERVKEALEELAPRETGREGRLERRREKGEYSRRERGDDGLDEMDEREVMGTGGGGMSGAGELQRLKERERNRGERVVEEGQARRSEWDLKEKERMRKILESVGMQDKFPV